MECFTCQTECMPSSKFCQNCGRDFRRKPTEASPSAQNNDTDRRNESMLAHGVIKSHKFKVMTAISVCALSLAGFIWMKSGGGGFPFLAFFALLAGISVAAWVWRFSRGDYYSIPGSKSSDGSHRCIWCGNRGVWKKGQYKTNLTHCNCAKCKTYLFTE
jgi:hypothetical protein